MHPHNVLNIDHSVDESANSCASAYSSLTDWVNLKIRIAKGKIVSDAPVLIT